MKKILRNLAFAALAVFAFSSCEDVPSPSGDPILPPKPEVVVTPVTCAEAQAIVAGMQDGATTAETYEITGYITDVFATVSRGQQSFWMADTQGGGKMVQAYWANLPEGVAAFTKDSKVKITGQLMRFVNNSGEVITEVKNADVVILDGTEGGEQDDVQGIEVTCAEAAELALALEDKTESEDIYTVTGYITDTDGKISRNQQLFWMADTKDGGKVFEAYWANIPDPTQALPVGTKVKMTGKLKRFGSTPEMQNGKVEVLEMGEGGETGGGETGDQPEVGDGMTINNLPADITTNSYGSQLAADESTWLTWTWNGVEFTGARICKANAINGTIQFQGNASDAAKQGFIFNKTAWPTNIQKITLVLKVKDAENAYDPSYSLYIGGQNQVHPTTNAVELTSTMTTDNGIRTYTQVFDATTVNMPVHYFTIRNDKAGVLYIEKIVVE